MDRSNGVSIVLLQAQEALRAALAAMLERDGYTVCGEAASQDVAAGMAADLRPDVILVEACRPTMETVETCGLLRRASERTGILVYADAGDAAIIDLCLRAGAGGFALKSGGPGDLESAIDCVAEGREYVDAGFTDASPATLRAAHAVLSPREVQVLAMLAGGLTGEEVASRLFLSSETVRTHVRNSMRKLGAKTRTHAVVLAFGLPQLPGSQGCSYLRGK